MQRVYPVQLFRRVQFTSQHCVTTRLFATVLRGAHSSLCNSKSTCNRVVTGVKHLPSNLTCHQYATQSDQGIFQRFRNAIGLSRLSKPMLRTVGYKLYQSLDQVDYDIFFKKLKMDDTFHSWFIVRGLHVWMLMARLMNEGEKGRLLRNAVVEAMWEDVEAKSKRLGDTASSLRRKQIQTLADEFQASLFSYDEGLMSSDTVLAGAIWRTLILQKDFDPRHLEALVEYVRENIATLDKISFDELSNCEVNWTKVNL